MMYVIRNVDEQTKSDFSNMARTLRMTHAELLKKLIAFYKVNRKVENE